MLTFLGARKTLSLSGVVFSCFLFLNWEAYRNAYSMTHFSPAGVRPRKPEELSLSEKARTALRGVHIPKPLNDVTPAHVGLPFAVHRFPAAKDVELEAWHIPHAQPKGAVLMFHGYAASKSSLVEEGRAFHDLGYETFLVDFRGSGGSSDWRTSVGYYEGRDVAQAVRYFQPRCENRPMILYGKSMGSAAILRAVHSEGVQPSAVILECPFDTMLNTVKRRFRVMGIPPFPSAHLLVFWGGWQNGFNAFAHNPVDYAQAVRCPALVMHGARDRRVSLQEASALFHNLGGRKRFELFRSAGHESFLPADPAQWQKAVAEFLTP